MSLTSDGQMIVCDGKRCSATAHPPVALRPELGPGAERAGNTAREWLYVRRNNVWRHYCPACARCVLRLPVDGRGSNARGG